MPHDYPRISVETLATSLKKHNVKYVLAPHSYERRRNDQSVATVEKPDLSSIRLGPEILEATQNLEPLAKGPFDALYDVDEVIRNLKAR